MRKAQMWVRLKYFAAVLVASVIAVDAHENTAQWKLQNASVLAPHRNPSFDYARDKVRGVNIGGWLVLEP
jgi:hypothetical protein